MDAKDLSGDFGTTERDIPQTCQVRGCDNEVTSENYCFGCGEYICTEHGRNLDDGIFYHELEDHND